MISQEVDHLDPNHTPNTVFCLRRHLVEFQEFKKIKLICVGLITREWGSTSRPAGKPQTK